MTAAKQKFEEATSYAVNALREVGKASAEQKLNYATLRAVNALEEIGIMAATELKFVITPLYREDSAKLITPPIPPIRSLNITLEPNNN